MKKTAFFLALLIVFPSTLSAFSDLNASNPFYNSITKLNEIGCVKGYEDGTVKPASTINRVETLKLLMTCLDLPKIYSEQSFTLPVGASYIVNGTETKTTAQTEVKFKVPFDPKNYPSLEFKDLDNTAWYIAPLKEALVRKLVTGYTDNTIKPLQTISKGEFFTFLYRLVPKELQTVTIPDKLANDAFKGQWFTEGLAWATQAGFVSNDKDGNVNPTKELSRGQLMHFIYLYREWLKPKVATNSIPTVEPQTPAPITASVTTPASPQQIAVGFTEEGIASFYGAGADGLTTASGEPHDAEGLMGAHKTLPFGTIVKVTNPENNSFVKVRINDRGPYVEGRIIDLSNAAFTELAPLSSGVVRVTIEVESLP